MTHKYITEAVISRLNETAANAVAGGGVDMAPNAKKKRKQIRVSNDVFRRIKENRDNWQGRLNLEEEDEFMLYLFSRNNKNSEIDITTDGEQFETLKT